MGKFSAPYEGIDESDEVLVAQAEACELVVAANAGEQVDSEIVTSVAIKASELAMSANLNLLLNRGSPVN